MAKTTDNTTSQPRFIWGMSAIAEAVNARTVKAAYHMCESGSLPGARKIGGRWALDLNKFEAAFADEAAA